MAVKNPTGNSANQLLQCFQCGRRSVLFVQDFSDILDEVDYDEYFITESKESNSENTSLDLLATCSRCGWVEL